MKRYNIKKEKQQNIVQPSTPKMTTVGAVLKNKRLKSDKTIEQVSNETKISTNKLKSMEGNDFSPFESSIHASGFIKIYADYLDLDTKKVLALYRREHKNIERTKEKHHKHLKKERVQLWKYLVFLIPLITLIAFTSYLYIQYYNFQNPPQLEIIEPKNNKTTTEDQITIIGLTEKDTFVEINNSSVSVNSKHIFEQTVKLQPGINILTIKATNTRNPSRESVEIITIEYEEESIEQNQGEEGEKEEVSLVLKITNADTWIEIIEDDQLIISEIVPRNYEENFSPKRNFSISTGIIENTVIEVNGENQVFGQDKMTLFCNFIEEEFKCN